ncbi:hypothetical protein [Saccharothrix variisporea]|uniref:AAA domain-containing protein n=1 Tax=Saccharothrix variisporea TaxID=543527 RepID=A0A495X633_9PSEU|nr:hypothetical protein [Saccharothrix variisporea]RKT69530.1 hypothetical protein DFJ66_2762 [Saccharothrix variisporea]
MATTLRLLKLTVTTASAERTYSFAEDLTVITGAVSTGKSSLLMLIKHALGGNAVLTPAVVDNVRHVTLEVVVGSSLLRLRREVMGDQGRVQLLELGSDVPERIFPISSRNPDETTLSRFLLSELGIGVHKVPKSRSRRTGDALSVGFGDVFSFCYLQARTIDSSATGHHDPGRDAKRKTMFEILLNIVDPEVIRLQVERNAIAEQAREQEKTCEAIRRFLEANGYADRDALRAERWDVQERIRRDEASLRGLRDDVDRLIERDRAEREQLSFVLRDAAAARERLAVARDTVQAREAALAQLRLDLARSEKTALAAGLLSPFEFVTCPRCLQSLTGRSVQHGHCLLCDQPEPSVLALVDDEKTAVLRAQLAETEELLRAELDHLRVAEHNTEVAEVRAAEAQRRYDHLTRDAVSPRVQAVAEASAGLERLRQRLTAIDQRMATWNRLSKLDEEVVQLKRRKRQLDKDIKQMEGAHAHREERFDELSEYFAAEVAHLGVRVNGRPTVSRDRYLPKIGDSDLDTLQASGGGSTTAINVAFSLALLNYTVHHAEVALPNLLILDSPRKGIGRTEQEDRDLWEGIFRRLQTLADAFGGRAQLLVADNDAELGGEKGFAVIRLTEKDSAVPGVPNTGVGSQVKVEDLDDPDAQADIDSQAG